MDWLGDHLTEMWVGLAIVLAIAEMASLDLILLMLALGALVGMVVSVAGAPFAIQCLGAAAAAVACLALVRPPLVRRLHNGPDLAIGHAKLVGQQGVVTVALTGDEVGRIKLAGEIWSAAPYDGISALAPGQTVEVVEIRGATALVQFVPYTPR